MLDVSAIVKKDLEFYANLASAVEGGMPLDQLLGEISLVHAAVKQHLSNMHDHLPASAEDLRSIVSELHHMNAEIQKFAMKINNAFVAPTEKEAFVNAIKEVCTQITTVGREADEKAIKLARTLTLADFMPSEEAGDLTTFEMRAFEATLHNSEQAYAAFAAMPSTHQRDPRILVLIRTLPCAAPGQSASSEAFKGATLIFNQQIEDLLITIDPALPMGAETVTRLRDLIDVLIMLDHTYAHMDDLRAFGHVYAHTNLQSNLALACRYLANHYRKEEQHVEARRYMLMPGQMKLLATHPLGDLDELRSHTENGQVVWARVDSTTVRRGQMRICQRRMGSEASPTLDFSCSLPRTVREELDQHLVHLQDTNQITVKRDTHVRYYKKAAEGDDVYDPTAYLELGLATELSTLDRRIIVTIGTDPTQWSQYHKVMIKVASDVFSQEIFAFLCHAGLSTLMLGPRPQDEIMERVTRLGAAMDPGIAALHHASPEGCARLFIGIDRTLPTKAAVMVRQDVGGGRMESVDPAAIQSFKVAGGIGFGATLGCSPGRRTPAEIAQGLDYFITQPAGDAALTLTSVLQDGMLSAMERFERGLLVAGRCPTVCVQTGSANQVFVRPLSSRQFTSDFAWGKYSIRGSILLLLSPDAAARMPYSYPTDLSGIRNPQLYRTEPRSVPREEGIQPGLQGHMMSSRLQLSELVKRQEAHGSLLTAETMFEDILGAQYIKGVVVEKEDDKRAVIAVLRTKGITHIAGHECEDAIFVSTTLREDMLIQFYGRSNEL